MDNRSPAHFASGCSSRLVFDQIADKWSMMALSVLVQGPLRFNAVKRRLEGVSQKALTQCLRRLERSGLVSRHVISVYPVAVEYEITALGRTLQEPLSAMHVWTLKHSAEVEEAQRAFDQSAAA
ncbi:MAG TPA: helix-turn-helix domain-containing protein [Burkholderiales bacterium]